MAPAHPAIGTLREGPLHAAVKRWYAKPGDRVETPVEGFVIDIVRDNLLIEIQTRSFSSMKGKLQTLLGGGHAIRIVHPIAVNRWIVKVDGDGAAISRRRSPRHGSVYDVFSELVSLTAYLASPNLEIEILLTEEEELRHHTPDASWRRRGWSVLERRLLTVNGSILLESVEDLVELLPPGLTTSFTTADIATAAGINRRVAQQTAYCLREIDGIQAVGKSGNSIEYSLV